MPDKDERKKLIEAIANSDDYYKDNAEALERLETALTEVEAIKKGILPKTSSREYLKELRDEKESKAVRKEPIREVFDNAVKQYGNILKRLDD